ncbi:uncharacterized protein C2orf72-like [Pogona vitticeps]
MERREGLPPSPPPPPPRGGGRRGCEGEAGAVVQRTQVVLLAGEPWGLESGQTVLSSFAHHVVPSSPPPPPGEEPSRGAAPPPGPAAPEARPLPSAPSGQLIFFLCRASSLREREARLREVLEGVREQSRGAPAVLVGVVVQPPPDEERGALLHLEDLLRDVFRGPEETGPIEVHTAVFAPGRPDGALELKRLGRSRVSRQASVSSLWLDKSAVMQILGAMLSFGTLVYSGYYLCNNLM